MFLVGKVFMNENSLVKISPGKTHYTLYMMMMYTCMYMCVYVCICVNTYICVYHIAGYF